MSGAGTIYRDSTYCNPTDHYQMYVITGSGVYTVSGSHNGWTGCDENSEDPSCPTSVGGGGRTITFNCNTSQQTVTPTPMPTSTPTPVPTNTPTPAPTNTPTQIPIPQSFNVIIREKSQTANKIPNVDQGSEYKNHLYLGSESSSNNNYLVEIVNNDSIPNNRIIWKLFSGTFSDIENLLSVTNTINTNFNSGPDVLRFYIDQDNNGSLSAEDDVVGEDYYINHIKNFTYNNNIVQLNAIINSTWLAHYYARNMLNKFVHRSWYSTTWGEYDNITTINNYSQSILETRYTHKTGANITGNIAYIKKEVFTNGELGRTIAHSVEFSDLLDNKKSEIESWISANYQPQTSVYIAEITTLPDNLKTLKYNSIEFNQTSDLYFAIKGCLLVEPLEISKIYVRIDNNPIKYEVQQIDYSAIIDDLYDFNINKETDAGELQCAMKPSAGRYQGYVYKNYIKIENYPVYYSNWEW